MAAFDQVVFDIGAFDAGSGVLPFSFTSTMSGASADYTKYMTTGTTKLDRDGDPDTLTFTLVPWDGSFVKLTRGAYITLDSPVYPKWFTGYVTNDPELTYLGVNSGNQVWGYKYTATDDSYLLSLKPVGLLPPFINMTAGEILKSIVSILDTYGIFDVSNIANGPLFARYIIDPNKRFKDIVKELADLAAFRFRANNLKLYFQAKDATPATITINGASSSNPHFSPSRLTIRPTADPIVNDAIVLGMPEPQNAVTEYMIGDGFTAQFPLLSGLYGADSATILSDDMSGSQLSTTNWTVFDVANTHLQLVSGYLNFLGGNANGSFDVHVDSAKVLPLESVVRITHGMWDFVSAGGQTVSGVIGGLWTQTPNSSYTGCIYGLEASKSGSNLVLKPIVNGTVDSTQSLTLDLTKRYVIRTLCNFNRAVRQNSAYSYVNSSGATGTYGGACKADAATFSTWITPVDPTNAAVGNPSQFINSGVSLSTSDAFATYILAAANDFHATVMGVTISVPMAAQLSLNSNGKGLEIGEDSFFRADGAPGYPWTAEEGTFAISGDELGITAVGGDTRAMMYWSSSTFPNDQYAQLTLMAPSTSSTIAIGPAVRCSTSAETFYGFYTTNTQYWLFKVVAGTETTLASGSYTSAAGDVLRLEVSGTTLTGKINGITKATATDAAIASGVPGIQGYGVAGTNPFVTNWSGGSLANVYVPKIVGVNEIDSLDGLAPVATIVTSGSGAGTGNNSNNVGLGSFAFNPGAATLTFFKDTTKQISYIPQVGELIQLAYKRAGISVGHIQDPSSISVESDSWGDDGVRSITRNDLSPVPRTSEECEFAAAAIVQELGSQHYEGEYTQFSLFEFTGEPLAGTVLKFINLPTGFPSFLQPEVINEVSTILHLNNPQEYFEHRVSFGKASNLAAVLGQFVEIQNQTTIDMNLDSADEPTPTMIASMGLVNVDDVTAPTLTSWTSSNLTFNTNQAPPTGGGFEVRLTDDSWGADDGKNLIVRQTSQSFVVPRNSRNKVCYLKAYDARNKALYSEDLTNAAWTKTAATVTNSTLINPDDAQAQVSTVVFGATGVVSQNTGIALNGVTGVFTISLKGNPGDNVSVSLVDSSTGFALNSNGATMTGKWQRVSVNGTGSTGGNFVLEIGGVSVTVQATWASFEVNASVETAYFKTVATAYGAMSRFASALRVNFPLQPPAPTAAFTSITDPSNPILTVILPTSLQDVWGVEIRASDNTTVLYHEDLSSSGFSITYTDAGNVTLTPSLYVYTYNLLGEYSAAFNATITFAILTSGLTCPTTTPGVPTSLDASHSGQGEFIFTWQPPAGALNTDQLTYQVQTATNSGFTTGVTTYGPILSTVLDLHNPNQTLYWRVLAKYPASSAGAYATFGSPTSVSSGLVAIGSDTTGTQDNLPNGSSHFSAQASTLSYRPLSNPLVGHDAGSNATINISAFTMRTNQDGDISVNSGSITALSYSTLYYIYYDDANLAGGAVTYAATTTKETALQGGGRFFVGSIATPKASAPDTVGDGDGGVGAQFGIAHTYTGSTLTVDFGGGSVTNANGAVDNDLTTSATVHCPPPGSGTASQTLTVGGFPSTYNPWSSLTLYIRDDVTANNQNAELFYSLDGGSSWTTIYNLAAATLRSVTTESVSLPLNQNLGLLQVKATAVASGPGGAGTTIDLYGIWVVGTQ